MNQTIEKAIRAHAVDEYPRESCGLIVIVKGRRRYVRCRNTAKGTEHFVLPAEDYANAEDTGEIEAIVHSHPDVPARPSQADLVSCENSGKAWIIVHVSKDDTGLVHGGEFHRFEPSGYIAPLVGRSFSHGVLDCYSIIRDWYLQERGITLPDFQRKDEWWNDGQSDLYRDGFAEAGFRAVPEGAPLEIGDVILMQIRSKNGTPNHGAVYIGDSRMIHHMHGRLSSVDIYGGYYREVTRLIVRRT